MLLSTRLLQALLLMAALTGASPAGALPPVAPELDRTCTYGDCEDGFGILEIKTELGTDEYEGNFRDGEFNGFGTYTQFVTRSNKAYYEGDWMNGQRHGRGTHWDGQSNLYIGEWRDGLRHGHGSYFFGLESWSPNRHTERWLTGNTESYTGEFVDDQYQGEGVYRWPDGRRYEGEFYANDKHGRGRFYYEAGTSLPQVWRYGKLVD
jgi:hypothetical protein